jgi:hypothetical protein
VAAVGVDIFGMTAGSWYVIAAHGVLNGPPVNFRLDCSCLHVFVRI